jgi:hypothetical protein
LNELEAGRRPEDRVLLGQMPDLDALPFPDRELFLEEWRKHGYTLDSPEVPFVEELPPPFLTIIAGRGCMYNCNFCQPAERKIFGRRVRRRSVPNIIRELQELRERYHFASFMFHDDCLTEDRELGHRILPGLSRGRLHPTLLLPEPGRHHREKPRHGQADGRGRTEGLLHRVRKRQ